MSTQDWDATPYAGPPASGPQQPPPSWPPAQPSWPPTQPSWPPTQPSWPPAESYGQPQPWGQQGPPAQPWGPAPTFPAPTGPAPWGQAAWAPAPPWGQPAWGQPAWGQPQPWGAPPRPQRSGLDVAGAVLAFVSTLLVLVGTVYAMAFSALLSLARGPSSGVGGWTAAVQLALAGLLVAGGVRALSGSRWWLLGAAALQLALSLYWVAVLDDIAPSTISDGVFVLPALYGGLALLAGGLPFLPEVRRWLRRRSHRAPEAPPQQPEPARPPWA